MPETWERFLDQRRRDIRKLNVAYALLAVLIVFTGWATWQNRQDLAEQVREKLAAQTHRDLELRLAVFNLCRSDGRTAHECRRIANGSILPVLTPMQTREIVKILGQPGKAGALGPQGIRGLIGKAGIRGKDGHDGAPGARGAPGAQGAQGTPGIPGRAGAQGHAGERGSPGARGPAGPAGPAGARGAPGPPGPAGTAACKWVPIVIPSAGLFVICTK